MKRKWKDWCVTCVNEWESHHSLQEAAVIEILSKMLICNVKKSFENILDSNHK